MVVIINAKVPVLEILEIKDKLTMNEIMSLQVDFPFKSFVEVKLTNSKDLIKFTVTSQISFKNVNYQIPRMGSPKRM